MKNETRFSQQIQRELKKIPNCWFYKSQEVGRRGTPDIIGCVNGQLFALELKTEDGVEAPLQAIILSRIAKNGGFSSFCAPNNWPFIRSHLLSLSRKTLQKSQVSFTGQVKL